MVARTRLRVWGSCLSSPALRTLSRTVADNALAAHTRCPRPVLVSELVWGNIRHRGHLRSVATLPFAETDYAHPSIHVLSAISIRGRCAQLCAVPASVFSLCPLFSQGRIRSVGVCNLSRSSCQYQPTWNDDLCSALCCLSQRSCTTTYTRDFDQRP